MIHSLITSRFNQTKTNANIYTTSDTASRDKQIMTELRITTQSDLLSYIKSELTNDTNLSIRGVERLCGIANNALIKGVEFVSKKLGQILTAHGFTAVELIKNGFNAQATWLVIEYFAYESKAKAEGAKQIARTFGSIGVMTTFEKLTEEPVYKLPGTYIEALEALLSAEKEKEILSTKLVEQQPKVEFAETVQGAAESVSVGEYAKLINFGRNRLFKWLRASKILDKNNVPYQTFVNRGYFKLTEKPTLVGLKNVTLITGKGQLWLNKKLRP